MLQYRPDPPSERADPNQTPCLLFLSVKGLLRPQADPASTSDTEQTQKEHRKQTLILLTDIKLLQKMTTFLYMFITRVGLTSGMKKL